MPNTVIKMPQLGESVAEGTIGRWLKQPGDRVERDEPLVEIQTDKVNAEVPSPVAGILQQILLPEGTTAAVKSDMAIIGDEAPSSASPEPAASPPQSTFSYDKSSSGGVVGHRDEDQPTAEPASTTNGQKRFFTPIVLRMAEEHALDLSKIQGSGAHGRVTRKDVERAIAESQGTVPPPPVREAAPLSTQSSVVSPPPPSGAEHRPLSPMRRAIADHMSRARTEIPDAWSLTELDVTNLVRQRQRLQVEWRAREGYELTYLPFFIKAVLAGLREVPELNATFACDHITLHREYHLG